MKCMRLFALAFAACATLATAAPAEMHGSADTFSAPGAKMAWAIARGASEADTFVVVRVSVDPAKYPWIAVVGVDPFTKGRLVRQKATSVPNMLDVRIARSTVGDYPNTDFQFFASEADARAGTPALVVFYHGVPDTAPEFTNEAQLDVYLLQRLTSLK